MKGGAARQREGRRRRRGGVEIEEAGALNECGSGSSHERLRSSRRRRSHERPPTPPPPLLLLPLLSFSGGGVYRGGFSPEVARFGRTRGCGAATYRRGVTQGTWTAGMQRRPAGRVATEATALPRFGVGISEREKGGG
jgi:hypothetical protein